MQSSGTHLSIFALLTSLCAALMVCAGAVYFVRRFRIERPAIGVFNGRDITTVVIFLSIIPVFYLQLPRYLLTSFLVVTFAAALSIGYRPVLSLGRLWLAIGLLLGLNIWMGNNMLGSVFGWQVFWAENDVIVLLAAVAVANLYVQGGMRMRHAAWFALVLAGYDVFFSSVAPVTNALVEEFLGYPLDPSFGMRWGFDNAAVGLGDLLVYALFLLTAYKAYGRKAARVALSVVLLFGAAVPSLVPLLINYIDSRNDTLVPAQAWFGPAAYLTYRWLRRKYGTERTMQQFLASDDVVQPAAPAIAAETPVEVPAVTAPAVETPAPEKIDATI
jgi:hypothetical protein